jgi:hypothetical protein
MAIHAAQQEVFALEGSIPRSLSLADEPTAAVTNQHPASFMAKVSASAVGHQGGRPGLIQRNGPKTDYD